MVGMAKERHHIPSAQVLTCSSKSMHLLQALGEPLFSTDLQADHDPPLATQHGSYPRKINAETDTDSPVALTAYDLRSGKKLL